MIRTVLTKANERYIPEYQICTSIRKDTETGAFSVIKTPIVPEAQSHLQAMAEARGALESSLPGVTVCPCSMGDDGLHFDYIEGTPYVRRLLSLCGGERKAYLAAWRHFLELLTPREDTLCSFKTSMQFEQLFGDGAPFLGEKACSVSAFDGTPSNLMICPDGSYVFIDYEWVMDAPLPLALLRYHQVMTTCRNFPTLIAVNPLHELLALIEMVAKEEEYDRALLHFYSHITGAAIGEADELMQYAKPVYDVRTLSDSNLQLETQCAGQLQMVEQLKSALALRDANLGQAQLLLQAVCTSKSWRLTSPLRFAGRLARKILNRTR